MRRGSGPRHGCPTVRRHPDRPVPGLAAPRGVHHAVGAGQGGLGPPCGTRGLAGYRQLALAGRRLRHFSSGRRPDGLVRSPLHGTVRLGVGRKRAPRRHGTGLLCQCPVVSGDRLPDLHPEPAVPITGRTPLNRWTSGRFGPPSGRVTGGMAVRLREPGSPHGDHGPSHRADRRGDAGAPWSHLCRRGAGGREVGPWRTDHRPRFGRGRWGSSGVGPATSTR